jgi:hypothetical protein
LEAVLEHPLEQHDRLYRLAYKDYLDNDLESARSLALEAVEKAHQFHAGIEKPSPEIHFGCRAATLLQAIEWRFLLAQDE